MSAHHLEVVHDHTLGGVDDAHDDGDEDVQLHDADGTHHHTIDDGDDAQKAHHLAVEAVTVRHGLSLLRLTPYTGGLVKDSRW